MNRTLWYRLVIPLIVLSGLALWLNTKWPAEGFFLNIAAEIVGIIITVLYVDWIIKNNEKERWRSTDTRIANRLQILLNATVSSIRSGLGFSPDIVNIQFSESISQIEVHKEIIRVAEHIIYPSVYERVSALDPKGWKFLANQVGTAHNGILAFFNAFQSRIAPDQLSILLDLQEALSHSLYFYTVFPDMAGVPEDELPQTRTPPEILQQSGNKETAKDLQQALILVKRLSVSITGTT